MKRRTYYLFPEESCLGDVTKEELEVLCVTLAKELRQRFGRIYTLGVIEAPGLSFFITIKFKKSLLKTIGKYLDQLGYLIYVHLPTADDAMGGLIDDMNVNGDWACLWSYY